MPARAIVTVERNADDPELVIHCLALDPFLVIAPVPPTNLSASTHSRYTVALTNPPPDYTSGRVRFYTTNPPLCDVDVVVVPTSH